MERWCVALWLEKAVLESRYLVKGARDAHSGKLIYAEYHGQQSMIEKGTG